MRLHSVVWRMVAWDFSMVKEKESLLAGYLLTEKGVNVSTADWRK